MHSKLAGIQWASCDVMIELCMSYGTADWVTNSVCPLLELCPCSDCGWDIGS